ncbi:MAG: diguanylate cyclase [Acidiferrobacterales bacterium]
MPADSDHPAPEKPRILVVDDSRVMRKAIDKLVNNEFHVTEAEDGETGWDKLLGDDQIQVVIADVLMPKLDGYALICRIRAADDTRIRDVPVIVITGAEDDETRERAFACGANDFITKPIDGAQLLACARAQARLDQTSRKLAQAAERLDIQASVDPLTQLNSRRFLLQRGHQDLAAAKRRADDVSLIRLDVDSLKAIYSQYGDDTGDRLLVWVANIIKSTTRAEDVLARTGAGEFAVLTPGTGRLEAAVLCERLRSAITAEPFEHDAAGIPVTASMGLVTIGADPANTIEDLLALAEERVAAAKAAGGNRLSVGELAEGKDGETVIVEQPDINTALEIMRQGNDGKLDPYLPELALTVLPLIELCNSKLDLEFDLELDNLKAKLSSITGDK